MEVDGGETCSAIDHGDHLELFHCQFKPVPQLDNGSRCVHGFDGFHMMSASWKVVGNDRKSFHGLIVYRNFHVAMDLDDSGFPERIVTQASRITGRDSHNHMIQKLNIHGLSRVPQLSRDLHIGR